MLYEVITGRGNRILRSLPLEAHPHVDRHRADGDLARNLEVIQDDGRPARLGALPPNFVIQGGDPYSRTGEGRVGTGGPGYTSSADSPTPRRRPWSTTTVITSYSIHYTKLYEDIGNSAWRNLDSWDIVRNGAVRRLANESEN